MPKIENLLDTSAGGSQKLPELPMPRDSHLLTPTSRALLRAARAGCTYIQPVRKDPEVGGDDAKEGDAAGPSIYDRTFTATKWTTLPRQVDPPEVEFLAKRRVTSTHGGAMAQSDTAATGGTMPAPSQTSPMRKTKFKKFDSATGNIEIYGVWIPGGYRVEGEIAEGTDVSMENPGVAVVAVSPAPGTLIEGFGVTDQEGIVVAEPGASMVAVVRKRYPPPKRKAKGVGKGRKKVKFAAGEGVAQTGAPSVPPAGTAQGASADAEQPRPDSRHETEGEEEEDEDEDGDDSGEDDESVAGSKPTTAMNLTNDPPASSSAPEPEANTASEQEQGKEQPIAQPVTPPRRDKSESPDIPLATSSTHQNLRRSKSPEETKLATEPSEDQPSQEKSTQEQSTPQEQPTQDQPTQEEQIEAQPAEEQRTSPPKETTSEPTAPTETFTRSTQEVQPESHQAESHTEASVGHDVNDTIQPPTEPSEPSQSTPQEPDQMQIDNPPTTTTSLPHSPNIPTTAAATTAGTIASPQTLAAAQPSPPKQPESEPESTGQPSPPKTNKPPVQFDDGEMDLLGSLEASLDKPSQPQSDQEPEPEPTPQTQDTPEAPLVTQHDEKQQTPSDQGSKEIKDTEMTG